MKDRYIGLTPTVFDSLRDGTKARAGMFDRARQIALEIRNSGLNTQIPEADVPLNVIDFNAERHVLRPKAGRLLRFGATVGLAGPVILGAVACGGPGEVQGENGNGVVVSPIASATKPPEVSPTIAPTVAPTVRPTEAPKATIPAQADKLLNDLKAVVSLNDAQRVDMRANFEADWAKASTERAKWSSYINMYSQLWAVHNVNKDPNIKAKMAEIEQYLKATWPDFYQISLGDPKAWLR